MLLFSKRLLRPGIFYQCLNLYYENNIKDCFELYINNDTLRRYIDTALKYDIDSAKIAIQLVLYKINPKAYADERKAAKVVDRICRLHDSLLSLLEQSLISNPSDQKYAIFFEAWEEKIDSLTKIGNFSKAVHEYILLLNTCFKQYQKNALYDDILANLLSFLDKVLNDYTQHKAASNEDNQKKLIDIINPLLSTLKEIDLISGLSIKTQQNIDDIITLIEENFFLRHLSGKARPSN